ncbi:MAG TPA: alpha-amylase family glycosyl hydrolase [Candidatus Nanopelagicaceae bacterium]|nr:alpha-amylase family glycosyl hydrolase [Candidatus Nanopelagicaceae bacterium]
MPTKEHSWPVHPKIFEINTWPWLTNLSDIYGHNIKLDSIPIELIDQELTPFDVVWLMGVWERSPIGREIAMNHEGLQEEYRKALRYYNTQDVVGSPYSVYYYHVSSQLGGSDALKSFRTDLMDLDLLLILDYVPNHVSIDHLWTLEKSDMFIKGTLEELMTKPYDFYSVGDTVYAHGKDPNFPPWTDTVQINAFSSKARSKAINTLLSIAEQCDGVRCDMAMLMINDVFSKTWGEKAGLPLENEYWVDIISPVKEKYPNFKFIAEVYWDMEWELIQQGFDFCYDKRLYERLIQTNVQSIKEHLNADINYQNKLLRFIENHDEPRVITILGTEASKAAAVIISTLPGARLIFEGQTRGYEIKIPVQLGRAPTEDDNVALMEFYDNLLEIIPGRAFDNGKWSLCKVKPVSSSDNSFNNIISYQWWTDKDRLLIVVNYSIISSKAHLIIEDIDFGQFNWKFTDLLTRNEYIYKGKDLRENGLYIELVGWNSHIFRVEKV